MSRSEIPLQKFGRTRNSRAGYAPLHNGERGEHDQRAADMPVSVRAAASTSSVSRMGRWRGRERERYADDPDEEATLLGDVPEDAEGFGETPQEAVRRDSSSQVRRVLLAC